MVLKLLLDGEPHEIAILRRRPHLVLSVDGRVHEISPPPDGGAPVQGVLGVTLDGSAFGFTRAVAGGQVFVRSAGRTLAVTPVDPRAEAQGTGAAADEIVAPMPGLVVSVEVAAGDEVKDGQPVMTIESMKLQTVLLATRDGVVAEILKQAGESFDKDAVVVRLAPLVEEA